MAASAASADKFDDIRPYRDDEVAEALARLTADSDLAQALLGFLWPRLRSRRWSPLRRLLTPLATALLRRRFGRVDSVLSLQSLLDDYLQRLVQSTTDGFSWSGIRQLPQEPCLFISNHRDITMDPALVDLALWRSGRPTVRIAVGDNLLRNRALAELIKLNKGFVVSAPIPKSACGSGLAASFRPLYSQQPARGSAVGMDRSARRSGQGWFGFHPPGA